MAQITSNGRFGICDKRTDFTNVNPYNITGAFIMYVNNDDKTYYFILTSTTSTSSVTPTMSDIPGLNEFPTGTDTGMPGISIYTDNSDQSKTLNSKVYNGAKQWYNNLLDTGYDPVNGYMIMRIDTLIMDNVIISQYDGQYSQYYINIDDNYNDYIILKGNGSEILKIFSDGSVTVTSIIAPDTTTTSSSSTTHIPTVTVEPTGLVNCPLTPTHTELPYVILYTEDDNTEHHKYNETLYKNIMINDSTWYNIGENCLIINDRIIPYRCGDSLGFGLDVKNECIYVIYPHVNVEIGVLYDNYLFELTNNDIDLNSLNIFDHSTIGKDSTTTTPNSTVTVTATYNPDSTTPTTTEYVTTPTTTSSTATVTVTNPDLYNKKFTIYARVHDENGNTISNFNINNIIESYDYGENYTRVYNDNSIIVYEFDNISPTYAHSIAPILNENYYFEEEDNIELYNIGNENIDIITSSYYDYPNSLVFWPGGITGDEAWIYVDIYPRSIYTTTSPASTMTTTNHSTDTTTPSPDTTTPITTGYSTTLTTTELVTTPTTTSSTATVTVTNPDNVTGTPLPRTTTPITTELITTPTTTGYSTTPITTSHSTTLTTTELVTTPTTTSSTATVTVTYNPDTTTPITTGYSTTLTTTELVTTPTTTSSTATITITPTITPIQEDIPICVNVHFNGNNYVYEDNIDDRFFVYGNRFSLTFDKYRPYSYESFDITHDDSLTNVTIGTAVDGVYIGCLYLSGDICRASNMHNIYININTATTTANKDEIDDSIDDIAPR